MSVLGTLITDFKNEALKVKTFLQKLEGEMPAAIAIAKADEAKLAPVLEAYLPGSAKTIQMIDDVFNHVAQAIEDAGTAAGSNMLSVTFDQAVVNDVKAAIEAAKGAASVRQTN